MILLEALESFVQAKEVELVEGAQPNLLLDQVFKVLKTSLKLRQSVSYLTHAYATLRTFVFKFPKALFTLNTQYCAKLCNLVLAHCNYRNKAVRSEASAIIYLFMKKNFEATKRKNFTRIKVATTIALSKLVGEGEVSDPAYLRRALDVLPEYVRADLKGSDAELESQAIQLVQRLKTILEDSVKSIRHAKVRARDCCSLCGPATHRSKNRTKTTRCWQISTTTLRRATTTRPICASRGSSPSPRCTRRTSTAAVPVHERG